jgi:hypothetical protein
MKDIEENKVWQTRQWTGGSDKYSISKECLHKVSWDNTICYDPMNHKAHPCKKGICPLYYKEEVESLNKN